MSANGWARKNPDTPAVKARKRKYDSAEHRAARARYKVLVEYGLAKCWRCGCHLYPGRWQTGHNDAGDQIMGPECLPCQRAHSARKGALIANAKRKATRFVRPVR